MAGKYTWQTTLKEMRYQVWRHYVEHHTNTPEYKSFLKWMLPAGKLILYVADKAMFVEKFPIKGSDIQWAPKVAGVLCKDLNVESEEEFVEKAKWGINIFCLKAEDAGQ